MKRSHFLKLIGLSIAAPVFGQTSTKKNSKTNTNRDKRADDITNYGALSDGKTDASSAIRACLKANSSAYIPMTTHGFIAGDIVVNQSKIHGNGTLIRKNKSSYTLLTKGSNCEVNGIVFKSQGSKYTNGVSDIIIGESSKSIRIHNCKFESSHYCSISADKNSDSDLKLTYKSPVKSIVISKNIFSGKYSRALYLHSVEDLQIIDNIIKETLYDGIRLRQRIKKCIISKNLFNDIGIKKHQDSQDAIDTYWSGEELIISDNIIKNCSKNAIEVKGVSPDSTGATGKVVISGNEILNTAYSAIHISSGASKTTKVKDFVIANNIIKKAGTVGAKRGNAAIFIRHGVESLVISSNIISENNSRGIFLANLEKDQDAIKNVTISANNLVDNGNKEEGYAILSSGVENCIISANNIENKNGLQKVAIAITDQKDKSSKAVISSNIISSNHKETILYNKKNKNIKVVNNLIN
ncbi:right-handed parallel beta-helix repeat-containing protein [Halobacteriovorax sp. YZS-1-1]|uniref:right-handed parallel beta-helix repeat-containing protein n=1 Tax=unclassified Halobacteriovorax TaxID=2639665 RepID=UPI003999DA31